MAGFAASAINSADAVAGSGGLAGTRQRTVRLRNAACVAKERRNGFCCWRGGVDAAQRPQIWRQKRGWLTGESGSIAELWKAEMGQKTGFVRGKYDESYVVIWT
jgi:hypothetical protein